MLSQQAETTATPHSPTYLEVENNDTENPTTYQRIKQSQTFQRTKKFIQTHSKLLQLLVFFTKETVDTTLDWLLFNDLNTQDEGLVFGAVDSWLLCLLCTFCCIGTVLTVLDVSNRVHELRTGSPFMNAVIPEVLTILLEDIPQLSIGLYILNCRGQTINPVALVTASFFLIGSLLYMAFTLYSVTKLLDDAVGLRLKYAVFILCNVIMILSLYTIMFTRSNQNTKLDFSNSSKLSPLAFDPFSILTNEGKRDLYFARVGIYGDTGDFDLLAGYSGNTTGNKTWMKFFEIYDIMTNGEVAIHITTDMNQIRVQIVNSDIRGNGSDICYRVNKTVETGLYFTDAADCALSNGATWHYRFKYKPPSMRYLLGDIQYNVRKTQNGSCDDTLQSVPNLKYFREKGNTNLTGHLYGPISRYERLWDSNSKVWKRYQYENMFTMYSTGENLVDMDEVWRTGISEEGWSYDAYAWKRTRCVNTGGVSPHFNPDINVPCYL